MICTPDCAPGKQRFDTHEEAARDILTQVLDRSREIDKEVCGLICQDNFTGKYFLAKETWWKSSSCPPGYRQCPKCGRPAAWRHTHGAAESSFLNPLKAEQFSPDDKYQSNRSGIPGYLGTPMGYLRFYPVKASDSIHLGPIK